MNEPPLALVLPASARAVVVVVGTARPPTRPAAVSSGGFSRVVRGRGGALSRGPTSGTPAVARKVRPRAPRGGEGAFSFRSPSAASPAPPPARVPARAIRPELEVVLLVRFVIAEVLRRRGFILVEIGVSSGFAQSSPAPSTTSPWPPRA